MNKTQLRRRTILSAFIALTSFGLAFAPLPGTQQTVIVVGGTELQEVLTALEERFEQSNPEIEIELHFQGSQELINRYLDDRNDFNPTVLIPASGELLTELAQRFSTQNQGEAFYRPPQAIAKTFLVGIGWSERGKVLFPQGNFDWQRLEMALKEGNWTKIGGKENWGSFDLVITDPTTSNSGQATLALWTQQQVGSFNFVDPELETLFSLIKRSVYQPPRSTDILLQEFITRGPNDADVAVVYESIALYRWQQSQTSQGNPYQIYYINPTIEAISSAAIVQRDVKPATAKAAEKFIGFLLESEQQEVFVQYGFRPVQGQLDLTAVPNSPWLQNIPGVQANPQISILPAPTPEVIGEIQRLWQRSNP